MSKVIFHIDLNCFYASVEMLLHPEYRQVPIVVVGNKEERKGIILTKNPIAKSYGIKTGEAIFEAENKCPNLVCVQADFFTYVDYSKRVKAIYLQYTPTIESFGIDEAWLDMGECENPEAVAKKILNQITFEIGLTVSIGIANNKVFAKLASDIAKPNDYFLIDEHNLKTEVWPLAVHNLLLVGSATKKKLALFDINTIGDLATTPLPFLNKHFGKWGNYLFAFSRGLDSSIVTPYADQACIKSIGNSMTCPKDCLNIDHVFIIMTILCESVCSRLKKSGFYATTVSIHVRNSLLESFTRQAKLAQPTYHYYDIITAVKELCVLHLDFKIPYRSLGIKVSNFMVNTSHHQVSLFNNNHKKMELENTLEAIRKRFGHRVITHAITKQDKDFAKLNPYDEHIIFPDSFFRSS